MQLSVSNHSATIDKYGNPITKFVIKRGDSSPDFVIFIVDDNGEPFDLSPYNYFRVKVAKAPGARPLWDMDAIVGLMTDGEIECPINTAMSDFTPGDYLLEVTLRHYEDGDVVNGTILEQLTIPGAGYGAFVITPRL